MIQGEITSKGLGNGCSIWLSYGTGGALSKNVRRTTRAISCANRVTWTRQHSLIRGEKSLNLRAFRGMTPECQFPIFSPMKKPANALALRAFNLVAGVGFEPTTFRL